MLVQLPEEQTQEIQQMIATLIKSEIHHFKEDIGADSPFLNKKTEIGRASCRERVFRAV